jgi:integrase
MPRQSKRLTAREVTAVKAGRHHDGGGLYLVVKPSGSRSWEVVLYVNGKSRQMGLGVHSADFGLAAAREAAAAAHKLARAGIDPIAQRRATGSLAPPPPKPAITFAVYADEYVEDRRPRWKNDKTYQGWVNSIQKHAAPLRPKLLTQITTDDVLACLKPIWTTRPEIARSTQQRIQQVFAAAIARELRSGANPADWAGKLEHLLPPKRLRSQIRHHASLHYSKAPQLYAQLSLRRGLGAIALQFLGLTLTRADQTVSSRWGEFDLKNRMWSIPMKRVKNSDTVAVLADTFKVPLSEPAIQLLRQLAVVQYGSKKPDPDAYVFVGHKGRPLSNNTMRILLQRMDVPAVPHGWRSTGREWAGDRMIEINGIPRRAYSDEACEFLLGHVVGDTARRAYRRDQGVPERRVIMDEWGAYLEGRLEAPASAVAA